jgi:hypothetical protein
MEGLNDFVKDKIKLCEDSNGQLSSAFGVEQGEIKVDKDPDDQSFCVADVTQEEVKVEGDPYDQLSSDVYVKHNGEEER